MSTSDPHAHPEPQEPAISRATGEPAAHDAITRPNLSSQHAPFAALQERLGPFIIDRKLGLGGQGTVYRAIQLVPIQRVVALKILNISVESKADAIQLRKEAERSARIVHPAVLPIYEFGQADGRAYLAMPLVDGGTLADLIKQRKHRLAGNPPADLLRLAILNEEPFQEEAVNLIGRIAHALAVAHEKHIVHRDIKPSNILIDRQELGSVYLSDFGLARDLDNMTLLDASSEPGTIAYMAPERLKSQRGYDEFRSDVYSLGITLYELVTLKKARNIPPNYSPGLYLRQTLDQEITPPRQIKPRIHPDLEAIILKATDFSPAYRYPNAGELAADLDRFRAGESVLARPLGPLTRNLRKLRKYRKYQTPLAIGLATLLTLGLVWQGVNLYAGELRSKARTLLEKGDFSEASYVAAQAQAVSGKNPEMLNLLMDLIRETVRQYRTSDDTTAFEHIHKLYADYVKLQQRMAASPEDAEAARRNFAFELSLAKFRVVSDRPDTWVTFHPTTRDGQPRQVPPLYALWAGGEHQPSQQAEVIDGVYWVTAYQPSTGSFVEFPYHVPHNAFMEPASLVLHPRTHLETAHLVTKIEGGSFKMGVNNLSTAESPEHPATVPPFYLGTGEVTQQAFDAYLTENDTPGNTILFRRDREPLTIDQFRHQRWPQTGHPSPDEAMLPWTEMIFETAVQFAAWYGCRLPSETELEYTARRNDGPLIPPGSPENWDNAGPPWNTLHPVGSLPQDQISVEPGGAKISGLYGNALEWTVFKFRSYQDWSNEGENVIHRKSIPAPQDRNAMAYELFGQATRCGVTETFGKPRWVLGYVERFFHQKATGNKYLGFRLARSEQPKIPIEKLRIPPGQK